MFFDVGLMSSAFRRVSLYFAIAALFPVSGVAAQEALFHKGQVRIVMAGGQSVTFDAEIANTPQSREIGLMHRLSLPQGTGMLFDFAENNKSERFVTMWMKNTHVPLDMLFVKASGHVWRIEPSTVPHSLAFIESGQPVRYVFEIGAGEAARIGVRAGDCVIPSTSSKHCVPGLLRQD